MAKQVQFRGGTTGEHSSFIGASREITVDTDKNTVVVHDGSTEGGFPLATKADLDSINYSSNYVYVNDTNDEILYPSGSEYLDTPLTTAFTPRRDDSKIEITMVAGVTGKGVSFGLKIDDSIYSQGGAYITTRAAASSLTNPSEGAYGRVVIDSWGANTEKTITIAVKEYNDNNGGYDPRYVNSTLVVREI